MSTTTEERELSLANYEEMTAAALESAIQERLGQILRHHETCTENLRCILLLLDAYMADDVVMFENANIWATAMAGLDYEDDPLTIKWRKHVIKSLSGCRNLDVLFAAHEVVGLPHWREEGKPQGGDAIATVLDEAKRQYLKSRADNLAYLRDFDRSEAPRLVQPPQPA